MLRGIGQTVHMKPVSQSVREEEKNEHGKDYMQKREYHIADPEI